MLYVYYIAGIALLGCDKAFGHAPDGSEGQRTGLPAQRHTIGPKR